MESSTIDRVGFSWYGRKLVGQKIDFGDVVRYDSELS
jgi:hypothetical protein